MKTTIVSTLAFITLQLISYQSSAQGAIDIGIKGGLSIPELTSGNSSNPINSGYNSRLGIDLAIQA